MKQENQSPKKISDKEAKSIKGGDAATGMLLGQMHADMRRNQGAQAIGKNSISNWGIVKFFRGLFN